MWSLNKLFKKFFTKEEEHTEEVKEEEVNEEELDENSVIVDTEDLIPYVDKLTQDFDLKFQDPDILSKHVYDILDNFIIPTLVGELQLDEKSEKPFLMLRNNIANELCNNIKRLGPMFTVLHSVFNIQPITTYIGCLQLSITFSRELTNLKFFGGKRVGGFEYNNNSDIHKETRMLMNCVTLYLKQDTYMDSLFLGSPITVASSIISNFIGCEIGFIPYSPEIKESIPLYYTYLKEKVIKEEVLDSHCYYIMLRKADVMNGVFAANVVSYLSESDVLLFGDGYNDFKEYVTSSDKNPDTILQIRKNIPKVVSSDLVNKDCTYKGVIAEYRFSQYSLGTLSNSHNAYMVNIGVHVPYSILINGYSQMYSDNSLYTPSTFRSNTMLQIIDGVKTLLYGTVISKVYKTYKGFDNCDWYRWFNYDASGFVTKDMMDSEDNPGLKYIKLSIYNKLKKTVTLSNPITSFGESFINSLQARMDPQIIANLLITMDVVDFYKEYYMDNKATNLTPQLVADMVRDILKYIVKSNKGLISNTTNYINTYIDNLYQHTISTLPKLPKDFKLLSINKPKNIKSTKTYKLTYNTSYINCDLDVNYFIKRTKELNHNPLVVLYGESGTGKSEFVRYISKHLNKELHIISITDYLKKYVGEGEENIINIFNKARESNGIILVDEADSLAPSRGGSIQDYKADMTNFVITELDKGGVTVFFTTNYLEALDKAILRRMNLKVEFKPLTQDSKIKLLKELCKIHSIKVPNNTKIESSIKRLTLTSGIFTSVNEKLLYYKDIDFDKVVGTLEDESEKVISTGRSMGFK